MTAHWKRKKLSEVCDLQNGYAFKSDSYVEDSNTLNIRMSNIRPEGNFDPDHNQRFLPDSFANEFSGFLLKDGDLIIAMTDMAGDPKILGIPTIVENLQGRSFLMNQRVGKLCRFSTEIFVPFLRYFLTSPIVREYYKSKGAGGLQINISKGDILSVQIPVPPISEQQRIVAILDEAFYGIATAKANAEKNLQNARALFESHLQAVFAHAYQIGELATLADLAIDISDGDHMPPPKSEEGVPFITIGNIEKSSRTIDFSDTFKVPHSYFNALKPNKKPKIGDVLYTVTGSFGIPVLVKDSSDFCFQRHIGLVRPKPETNSAWLYYLLMSPQVFKQATDGATGAAQKTVSLKLLRGFQVPLIPLAQQMIDVAKFDALVTETQRLESIYQQKLAALDDLKKSLLHQAFKGEL